MTTAHRGVSWDNDERKGRSSALVAAITLIGSLVVGFAPSPAVADDGASPSASALDATGGDPIEVIVRESTPSTETAETLVRVLGGTVEQDLQVVGGFTATVPASMIARLADDPSVSAVTPNAPLQLSAAGWTDATGVDPNPATYDGSVNRVADSILQAPDFWSRGVTGVGIDVALIDSGVVPVNGLTYPGKVINGPDLSFESQSDTFRYLDTFGHGTHLAGIIAGRDDGAAISGVSQDFLGVAPGARIVSIKVAGHDGATDVSQVIAAIDWVVQHKNENGLNIRVLNLAFGTESTQSYVLDPLAYAVEQAWKAGIVVVVAAGNDGNAHALRNPAMDPYVIAVGASNKGNTRPHIKSVMEFSNCGTNERSVDVVVPGESIASIAAPGSSAFDDHPTSVVGGRYMLGSGTSQSTAFVTGAAALILGQRPDLSPDQVKGLLTENSSGKFDRSIDPRCYGAGLPDLAKVRDRMVERNDKGIPNTVQRHTPSIGLGSLESSRGSDHVEMNGVVLEGERDIFGNTWGGTSWSTAAAQGTTWSGGDWNGSTWSGVSWSGVSWSGVSWSGVSWSGVSWSGVSWSGTTWSNQYWNGTTWSGTTWSGTTWSGTTWSGAGWLGKTWD